MIKLSAFVTTAFLLFACSNNGSDKNTATDKESRRTTEPESKSIPSEPYYNIEGNTVTILPFEIEVVLSPKAIDKIKKAKETIIVDVFFTGTPKDSINAELEEDGSFFVTSAKKEIQYGEIVKFDTIHFSKAIYDQLLDKDIDLGVNIYSGRKSSGDNLLDVEPLFDKISKVVNKKFTLKGKLIYGDD